MAVTENGEQLAPHACNACKRQKRKCTKELPKCSLCARMSRDCDYSNDSFSPSTENVQALQNRIFELENLLFQREQQLEQASQQSSQPKEVANPVARHLNANPFEQFPALFFLDYDIFKEARMTIPKPSPPIPEEIYQILGSVEGLRKIASLFFVDIHPWFPLLCQKRFEILLSDPKFVPSPDLALLFAAMKLLTDEDSSYQSSTKSNSYWDVKNYSVVLEANAVMTPQLIQAKTLMTVYELAHAIYPAAYLSIANCAALCKACGLDNRKDAPQMLRRYGAWAEIEELRRLWWATLVLDRVTHLSLLRHALTTEDPARNEVLPADDTRFSQAEMSGNEPLYVGSPTNLKAGPFTRTCQAAHLVGQVANVLNELVEEVQSRFTTALQVLRTLFAFVKVVQADFNIDPERYATPMALAYSALISLCDPYCCTENNRGAHTVEEAELQTLCITGIKSASDDVAQFALALQPSISAHPSGVSPFLGHCLYMATVTFAWRIYEGGEPDKVNSYRLLRDTLNHLNRRWAVGGEYLQSVDKAKEMLYNTPLLDT